MTSARKSIVAILLVAGLAALSAMVLLREHGSAQELVSTSDKGEKEGAAKQSTDKGGENRNAKSNQASKSNVDSDFPDTPEKSKAPPTKTPPLGIWC